MNREQKLEIIHFLETFAHCFDSKNWDLMSGSLAPEIFIDFSSFRDKPATLTKREVYIEERKIGLQNLKATHKYSNFRMERNEDIVTCECEFVIKRFN